MLSQFTREAAHHKVLGDLFQFESDIYPVGRLDRDSEGLLVLTNDKKLTDRLLNPKYAHPRTYWAQVEGAPIDQDLAALKTGVPINHKGKKHQSVPVSIEILKKAPKLEERDPPVRFRKSIPTTWVEITLTEGKNRQVRKLLASVGFPVLRLVRSQIEGLKLATTEIGHVKEWKEEKIKELLGV